MAVQSKTAAKTDGGGGVEAGRSSGAEVDAFLVHVKSMTPMSLAAAG